MKTDTIEEKIARVGELADRRRTVLEELQTIDTEFESIFGGSGPRPLSVRDKTQEKTVRGTPREADKEAKRTERILHWLVKGKMPAWVAMKTGVDVQTVYNVKAKNAKLTRRYVKGSKKVRCNECGTTGSRHFKTCSRNGQRSESIPSFKAPPVAPTESGIALEPQQYDAIREAMHDKEFQSGRYALTNKLSPREVNAVVVSRSYEDYLDNK